MSDAQQRTHADPPHEGPIKTPKQVIAAVIAAFVIPIAVIGLLVAYVAADRQTGAGSEQSAEQAVAQRLRPIGRVEVKDTSDPAALKSGEQVYAAQCVACHGSGAAGAPKLGDATAWAPRLKAGFEALLNSALKGKGAMPPQGGGDHTDFEIARAVVYMTNKAGAKFEEPKQPAPGAQAAAPAAPTPAAASAVTAATVAASVATAAPAAPPPAPAQQTAGTAPPALYGQVCQACHAAGVAGAPKLGDKAAWAPRISEGLDALTAAVIKGKGAMPPRGGSAATDADIRATVSYMVGTVK
jgi:cytochrome c5